MVEVNINHFDALTHVHKEYESGNSVHSGFTVLKANKNGRIS